TLRDRRRVRREAGSRSRAARTLRARRGRGRGSTRSFIRLPPERSAVAMSQYIVGVFDHQSEAQQAARDLMAMGIDRSDIRLSQEASAATTAPDERERKGFWQEVKEVFGF